MDVEKLNAILKEYAPIGAVDYCISLWKKSPFDFKVTKKRNTKVGDFTSKGHRRNPRITINQDLNPYLFLQTFIHEVAHLHVYITLGNKVEPHGDEWKRTFSNLMLPLLAEHVFPQDILIELHRHMANPKASSYADPKLIEVFRKHDKNRAIHIVLSQLPEGSVFNFHGRYFKKGKLRRTRILCQEIKSKRNYLVPADALVSNVQLSLL